jgi:hypothetical protein
MLKVYAPYFFKPSHSKDGKLRQFNTFQKLTILQLLHAAHCYDEEMFASLAKDIEDLLQPLATKTNGEVLRALQKQSTCLDALHGDKISKFYKLYDCLDFALSQDNQKPERLVAELPYLLSPATRHMLARAMLS